jgi:hypothetical protein
MADITAGGFPDHVAVDIRRLRKLAALIFAFGLLASVAASDRMDRRECRPFTFGVSAFGSCDWLG